MNLRMTIPVFGLICTAALLCATADEPVLSGKQGAFPIICVLGPPADDNRLEHWQRIKDANFTLVLPSFQYDDTDQLKMLNHCRQVGLGGIVHVKRTATAGSSDSPPDGWRQIVGETVERYADHPALFGYMVRDEPGADLFVQLGRVVDEIGRRDPRHPACINLFPVHATDEQLQTSTYAEYLDRYLQTVKPPFLSYDHYPLLSNNSDRPDFFLNLELARAAGAKHKTPVWTVVLSGWGNYFRKPTAAELRWQVYGALAYGVRGVAYFAYWPTRDDYTAVVDYAGRPQPLYKAISELNRSVLSLGRVLRGATSTAVYHTGNSIPEGCRRLPAESPLVGVPRELPLVIGLFESGPRDRYAMIVNRDYRQPVTVPVEFGREVRATSIVTAADRSLRQASRRRRIELVIPPGDAVLLRLRL